jgi:hypothetical protein
MMERRQQFWLQVRFEKKTSESLQAETGALLKVYREVLAGRELRVTSLNRDIQAQLVKTERAAVVLYNWIDPPSAWYAHVNQIYLERREKGGGMDVFEALVWLHFEAPLRRAIREFLWRWRRYTPQGSLEVLQHGRTKLVELIADQRQLNALLKVATQPENHHELEPAESLVRSKAIAERLRRAVPPPLPEPEATPEAPILVDGELPPAREGYVRVGPLGVEVMKEFRDRYTGAWAKPEE